MSTVVLTPEEHAETLAIAAVSDPPRHGIAVGEPTAAANLQAAIPETYNRLTHGTTVPLGWSVSQTWDQNEAGEVELREAPTYRQLETPGAAMTPATALKLLTAVGERGDRLFSLEFAFAEFSGAEE